MRASPGRVGELSPSGHKPWLVAVDIITGEVTAGKLGNLTGAQSNQLARHIYRNPSTSPVYREPILALLKTLDYDLWLRATQHWPPARASLPDEVKDRIVARLRAGSDQDSYRTAFDEE